MRVVLTPRTKAVYGQDFASSCIREQLKVDQHFLKEGLYPPVPNAKLVVSHNPDLDADCEFFATSDAKKVVHTHLQWSYLDPLGRAILRRSVDKADVLIAPARFVAEQMGHETKREWEVVENRVPRERFLPSSQPERDCFRNILGIPAQVKLIAVIGRLEAAKGTSIVRSLALSLPEDCHLLLQYPDRRFQKVGDEIVALCPGRVTVFFDSNRAADRPVRHVDVLISPSLKEVVPLVILEALTAGLPVLATRSTYALEDELKDDVVAGRIRIVDFDPGTRPTLCESSRCELRLGPSESERIAKSLIDNIQALAAPNDESRRSSSEAAARHSDIDGQVNDLRALYE